MSILDSLLDYSLLHQDKWRSLGVIPIIDICMVSVSNPDLNHVYAGFSRARFPGPDTVRAPVGHGHPLFIC